MAALKSNPIHFILFVLLVCHSVNLCAEWGAVGELTFEGRAFESDSSPETVDEALAFSLTATTTYESSSQKAVFKGIGRVDGQDYKRNIFIPQEAWWSYRHKTSRFYLGLQVENWSFLEVFNPSDVFNSRNLDSDVEDFEKIGELALQLRSKFWGAYLSAYYMPFFISPFFPSQRSRLNPLGAEQNLGESSYLANGGQLEEDKTFTNQWAIRLARQFGDMDLAFHSIYHIDREQPAYAFNLRDFSFQPLFFPVLQSGIAGTWIEGNWIFKFDIVNRDFKDVMAPTHLNYTSLPDHQVAALGVEYVFDTSELSHTVFSEWQKTLGLGSEALEQSLSFFQNDLLLGYRLTFNDLQGKELRFLSIFDLDGTDELILSCSFSSRIGSSWKVATGFKSILAPRAQQYTTRLSPYDKTNYIFLNLTHYL